MILNDETHIASTAFVFTPLDFKLAKTSFKNSDENENSWQSWNHFVAISLKFSDI
jgi:hypothetical protein